MLNKGLQSLGSILSIEILSLKRTPFDLGLGG